MINPLRQQIDQDKSFTRLPLNVSGQFLIQTVQPSETPSLFPAPRLFHLNEFPNPLLIRIPPLIRDLRLDVILDIVFDALYHVIYLKVV